VGPFWAPGGLLLGTPDSRRCSGRPIIPGAPVLATLPRLTWARRPVPAGRLSAGEFERSAGGRSYGQLQRAKTLMS
jgi:hypothetical protein